MKKYIIFLLMVLCSCTYANSNDKFIESLRNCSIYSNSETLNVNNMSINSKKQLSGWQNGKCSYRETVQFAGNNIVTSCSFTKPQIQEIVSVADAYYLTRKYTNEELDLTSPESVQNNPLARVMGKYLQDSSVCTMSGL